MLKDLEVQIPIKENPDGSPSLWYMPLIGGEHFFDGFGFAHVQGALQVAARGIDDREDAEPPTGNRSSFPRKLEPKASFEMGSLLQKNSAQ
jgi:hypothetical protein